MTYNPFSAALFVTSLLCLLLVIYVWRQRRASGSRVLAFFLSSVIICTFAYGMMLMSNTLAQQKAWLSIRYLGDVLIAPAILLFILWYTGHNAWLRPRRILVLFAIQAFVFAAVLTNDWHHLYYAQVWLETGGLRPILAKTNGPLYWVEILYTYLCLMISVFLLIRQYFRAGFHFIGQTSVVLLSLFFPVFAHILYIGGFRLWGVINPTYYGYVFSGAAITAALFRFHLFELRPIARDTALEKVPVGILVLDGQLRLVEANPAARALLSIPVGSRSGTGLGAYHPAFAAWLTPRIAPEADFEEEYTCEPPCAPEPAQPAGLGQASVYWVGGTPIRDGPLLTGWVILLRNITPQVEMEKKALEQQRALASLAEREQLARDLHDSLGQVMGTINVQAQAALEYLRSGQVGLAQASLHNLAELAGVSHNDLRELLLGLRQKFSETPDFYTALEKYLQDFTRVYGLPVEVSLPVDGQRRALDPATEVQLLRVVQEALSNIRKHARANHAQIFFRQAETETQVVIEDDGIGFESAPEGSPAEDDSQQHYGQAIMRERIAAIGGELSVLSAPGQGTRVIIRIPRTPKVEPAPSVGGLRVIIADDHPLFRDGLRNLLLSRGVRVVGLAKDGQEALDLALELRPDIAILDIHMPGLDGIEAAKQIKLQAPEVRILILTMAADDATLFRAIRAGASGYLLKDLKADEFLDRLEALMRGETPISPGLAQKLLAEFAATPEPQEERLTERQLEILQLMAQRLTYAQIAQRLYLSESAVKYHAAQIMGRLHTASRNEALAEAARRGWIERRGPRG